VSASLLCRAGVGFLRLVDRDYVGLGNLQRGTLFTEDDVHGLLPKAVAAQKHLEQVNADVEVKAVCTDINPSSILNLIKDVDLVLDGTDNFELRFLLNEACHKLGIPWVHGAALGTTGTCMTILPQGPCLCCLMPLSPPPGSYETCATAGILGSTTTAVAALQCAEALKLLTGTPVDEGVYRLLDVWNGTLDTIEVQKAPNCKVCGQKDYSRLNKPSGAYCTSLCGRDEIQVVPQVGLQVDLDAIARRLAKLGTVEHTPYLLDFTTDNLSFKLFNDGRALFKDIDDEATVKSLYAEYIGL
jgi:adenylyltransferase/sulfurtransferase